MYTLGINAAFHDCSACLVSDCIVVAAAEGHHLPHEASASLSEPFDDSAVLVIDGRG